MIFHCVQLFRIEFPNNKAIFLLTWILSIILTKGVHSRVIDSCLDCECWIGRQLHEQNDAQNPIWTSVSKDLPNVSIIITAYNEDPKLLRRTLDRLWINTPVHLIEEVILVDDHSDRPDFNEGVPVHPKIQLVRNSERLGLIRSRMVGARLARAAVLVFLDSHVSTDPHWLEPLVARLVHVKNLKVCAASSCEMDDDSEESLKEVGENLIVSPVVYDLSDPNPAMEPPIQGGFFWNLTFRWEYRDAPSPVTLPASPQPWPTPAISGGLFAIWRSSFFSLGGYDEQMEIWGGENIELSLRTWMCHGRMEIVPCSRVGHVYNLEHPYSFPAGKQLTVVRNLKRAALVWLLHIDSKRPDYSDREAALYMSKFYASLPTAIETPVGEISDRSDLGVRLGCRSFGWFLDTVYPQLKREADSVVVSNSAYKAADMTVKTSSKLGENTVEN